MTVTGSDGYQVTFSLGELSPSFGNNGALVAYSDTAGQIAAGAGFARLVVPGDVAGGRFVSNLYSMTIFDPTIPSVLGTPGPVAGLGLAPLLALAGAWIVRRRARGTSESSAWNPMMSVP